MLQKMNLSFKLIGGFVMVSLFVLIVGLIAVSGLNRSKQLINANVKVGHDLLEAVNLARTAQVNFKKQVQEWKDILLRGNNPAEYDKYFNLFVEAEQQTQANLTALKTLMERMNIPSTSVDDSIRVHQELGRKYREALRSYDKGNPNSYRIIDQMVKGIDRAPTDSIDAIVNQIISYSTKSSDELQKESVQGYQNNDRDIAISIIGMLIGTIVALVLGILLSLSISKPLLLAINDLRDGAHQVNSASQQLSDASQQLAEGNAEQATAIEETSANLEEASAMIDQNTNNTKQATVLAGEAKNVADEGNDKMQTMLASMDELIKSSDHLAKIIKTIDDIAFQTNILALNAAVESARAGESGMGFAVVAEEVRNLAQRSANEAKSTAAIIETNIDLANKNRDSALMVGESLKEIMLKAKHVSELLDEISAASQEQANGIKQINLAISQMEKVTQQNSANSEETASAAEELTAQANAIQNTVQQLVILVNGFENKQI